MNKVEYLRLLEDVLKQNDVEVLERRVILEDYEELYDGYLEREMSDAEIKKKLGSPYEVVASLKGSMRYERSAEGTREKLIAISPFVALIMFFVFGFLYEAWHPAWLVFLIIPVGAILLASKEHFFVMLVALMPFITTTIFILYGYYSGVYHPTWMVFLLILLAAFMVIEEKRKYLYVGLLLLLSGLYLFVGLRYGVYDVSLLLYTPLIALLVYFGDMEVSLSFPKKIGYISIITLIVYFVGGYFFDLWTVLWLIFFLIPVYAIHMHEQGATKYIAITPFVSVTIFYLLGFYADLWALSWMAFLLVPMVAIVLGDHKKN